MFKLPAVALLATLFALPVAAQETARYQVRITNITQGQTFTPQLVATHSAAARLFSLGRPASEELEILAEGGDTGPLSEALAADATDIQTIDGLLGPGERATIIVEGIPGEDFVSIAAMLIPTNDSFVALHRAPLPRRGAIARLAPAYDAGTELNDQSCLNIPGPRCGGEGHSPDSADQEGFVHIGNGFHELGEMDSSGAEILGPEVYDWRNPVASITVKRLD